MKRRIQSLGVLACLGLTGSTIWAQSSGSAAVRAEGMNMALYGAPVQTGPANQDAASSSNATLPNGRRVTPAGTSVQVGENPLNSILTPDGQYLITSNSDERSAGAINTKYSSTTVNGAGKTPGGFVLTVTRTSDLSVVGTAVVPVNPNPTQGPKSPGKSQSDKTNGLFLGLAVKAAGTGYTLYASGGYSDLVYVYALGFDGTPSLTTSIPVPLPSDPLKPNFGLAMPAGMTLTPDGSTLYVVNDNANNVITIDTSSNKVIGLPLPAGYFPYADQLSPDGTKLYVTNWGVADRSFGPAYVASYDKTAGSGIGSLFIGGGSSHVFANPATDPSSTSSVSIVSLNGTHRSIGAVSLARTIDGLNVVGGTHPSAMATITRGNLSVLYVASTNDDTLALIDTKTDSYLGKIPMQSIVPGTANRVMGQQPDALAASPDGTRLYVAEAGINAVSVYDTSTPSSPRFLGRIPTGWYPSAVTVSPDNTTLYITNAKGYGSDLGFQGQTAGNVPDVNLLFGSVQKVAVGSLDLAAGNTTVQQNTYQILPSDNLAKMANLSTKIHHVFFILRENKTYDSYLGNDAVLNARGANGNPTFAAWDKQIPNTKALAEQFSVGDNSFADSEESDAGHYFALAGGVTDYTEKTLLMRFSRPFMNTKNQDPEDYPLNGFEFHNAARSQVSYRDYGDLIRLSGYDEDSNPNPCVDDPYPNCDPASYDYKNTTAPTMGLGGLYTENIPAMAGLDGHVDLNYPGWSLKITDQRRELEFEKDMNAQIAANTAPAFTYIWLPNDHTGGGLNPKFEVSDNDAALGKLISYLSHGPLWKDSAIFVTEDDAQSNPDHVNAHRSYVMVLGPYAKRGAVVHRLSSTVSVPKTIEELLGMPPMNVGDLVANDLSDYFTTTPDLTPYTALPQAAPPATAAVSLRIAKLTSQLDYSTYDRDNARLTMLNTLFAQSENLAAHRPRLTGRAYQRAQDALYAHAQRIIHGSVLASEDSQWTWQWLKSGMLHDIVTPQQRNNYVFGRLGPLNSTHR